MRSTGGSHTVTEVMCIWKVKQLPKGLRPGAQGWPGVPRGWQPQLGGTAEDSANAKVTHGKRWCKDHRPEHRSGSGGFSRLLRYRVAQSPRAAEASSTCTPWLSPLRELSPLSSPRPMRASALRGAEWGSPRPEGVRSSPEPSPPPPHTACTHLPRTHTPLPGPTTHPALGR